MITTQYRDEVYTRALDHNSQNGRCMTALRKVFDKALSNGYPEGTNIIFEFAREMIGLPYGDNGLSLDYKADCSQWVINVMHYFFGISNLGSYTQSLYDASGGTKYYDWKINPPFAMEYLNNAPPLSYILYKFSDRNPDATHAALKVSATQICHTRSTSKPLMFSPITYEADSSITQIRDLLSPEQHAMVIVGNTQTDYPYPEGSKKNKELPTVGDIFSRDLKLCIPRLTGDDVKVTQQLLIKNGYSCGKAKDDGIFGGDTDAAKTQFQKANNINTKNPLRLKLV